MTTDQQKAFEQSLTASLARVNEWLRFAETKIAALVTFSSAWLVAMGNMAFGTSQMAAVTKAAFAVSSPLVFAALFAAFAGAFPRINLARFFKTASGTRNLLFFGDLRLVPPHELLQALADRYRPEYEEIYRNEYLNDLSVQIGVNSQLANFKFLMCNWSLFFLALAAVAFATFSFIPPARLWALGVFH